MYPFLLIVTLFVKAQLSETSDAFPGKYIGFNATNADKIGKPITEVIVLHDNKKVVLKKWIDCFSRVEEREDVYHNCGGLVCVAHYWVETSRGEVYSTYGCIGDPDQVEPYCRRKDVIKDEMNVPCIVNLYDGGYEERICCCIKDKCNDPELYKYKGKPYYSQYDSKEKIEDHTYDFRTE